MKKGWILLLAGLQKSWKFLEKISNRLIALGTIVLALTSIYGLRDARETFEAGSRAWIAPVAAGLQSPLEKGKPINFGAWYDNVGKIPAIDVHPYYLIRSFSNADMENGTAMDVIEKTDICNGINSKQGEQVLYPNAGGTKMYISFGATNSGDKDSITIYNDLMAGTHTLVIQICIAYKTINKIHHSSFCYFHTPNSSKDTNFNRCPTGNNAD